VDSTKSNAPAAAVSAPAAATPATAARSAAPPVIILDMKRMSRKKLRRLRKGRGSAMAEMNEAIDEFRHNGTIAADAQLVIAIVKQKDKRSRSFWSP